MRGQWPDLLRGLWPDLLRGLWPDLRSVRRRLGYHVPSPAGPLYVKFTADVVTEFVLLSFKEKGND